ncbi:MAG: LexA family transcriptional regulator [Blastocatellia bacterium]|nr:LexA family transcriptional regulator [Blastocatellia bacterium]
MDKFIADRLSEIQKQRGFSLRWLCQQTNINRHTVDKMFRGDVKSARDKIALKTILEFLQISDDEFYGRPAMQIAVRQQTSIDAASRIPLYGDIAAGIPNPKEGVPEPDEWIEPVPGIRTRGVFALRVQGLSMSPHLLPNDILYLESLDIHIGPKEGLPAPRIPFERLHGRIVAALIDGEATLKVLRVTPKLTNEDFDLHLMPINRAYPDIYITPQTDLRIQGVVLKALRDENVPVLSLVEGEANVR